MTDLVHIMSLNAQGLSDFNKRTRLIQCLNYQTVDIVFLQETHFTTDLFNTLAVEFSNWSIYNAYGTSNNRGCSILINKLKYLEITYTYLCTDGR